MVTALVLCVLTLPAADAPPAGCVLRVGTARFRVPDHGRVSWSADGKYLAVAGPGYSLALLDPDTGLPVRRFAGGFWEGSFALPGGDRLVLRDRNVLRVFDTRTGDELESTDLKLGALEGAGVLPGGDHYLVTAAWDAALADLRDRTRPGRSVRLAAPARGSWFPAAGGKRVLFAEGNGNYLLLEVPAEKATAFSVPLAVGSPLTPHPDGTHLYLERGGDTLVRADLAGKELAARKLPGVGFQGVAVSPGGKELYAGPGPDGRVRALDAVTLEDLRPLASAGGTGWGMKAASPDGRWLGFLDGNTYRVVDVTTGRDRAPAALAGHRAAVRQVAADAAGRRAVSVDTLGSVRVTDLATGRELAAFTPPPHPAGLGWPVAFLSPDGDVVVVQNAATGALGGWDVRAGAAAEFPQAPKGATVLGFSAAGRLWLATADRQLRDLDLRTGRAAAGKPLPWSFPIPALVTADGSVVVSLVRGLHDVVSVWRPGEDKAVTSFDRNDPTGWKPFAAAPPVVGALSPDGRYAAFTREADRALDVVALATGKRHSACLGEPPAPGRPGVTVTALAFSPDGRRLAVGLSDGTVRFRDPAAGGEEFRADLGVGGVTALAFTAGGRLVAGGADTTVTVWDVPALTKKAGK
ncbi:MAG: hypothetical protein C0501_15350 [Isosphaera sp.]|nr:hypothetical protein [Isosphaera sp.]